MYDFQILKKWSENQVNIQLAEHLITAKALAELPTLKLHKTTCFNFFTVARSH